MVTFGLLAQLVEQLTFNQLVAGSNPAQPITGHLAQRSEHPTHNRQVQGSIP